MKFGMRSERLHVDEENPYWISFSDIMAGLLVIFILASLALILELTQTRSQVSEAIQEIAKGEQVRREILHEIKEELARKNIVVEVSDNDTVLRIPDRQLSFHSNEYVLPDNQALRVDVLEIGHTLYNAITRGARQRYLDTIFIEGHTDSRPSNRQLGNWGLSTFRAIAVWDFWNGGMGDGKRLSDLKNHDGKPLFSVSGYAETRPVNTSEMTEDELRQNRRIDIRFTVKRPSINQYQDVDSLLSR